MIKPKFVVSMSTVPSRIAFIEPTIKSILNQSVKPDAFHIVIPYYSKREKKGYEIPSFILNDKNITIIRCKKDYGPATKLLPVLQHEKNPATLILTVDDDRIYDKDMIKDYLKYVKKYPEAILGRRGWRLRRPFFNWPDFSLIKNATIINKAVKVDVLTGVGSVLYRKKLVPNDVFHYEKAPKECFFNDDIWFCGHFAKYGIDRIVIPTTKRKWHLTNKTRHADPENKLSINHNPLLDFNRNGYCCNIIVNHFLECWGKEKEYLKLKKYYEKNNLKNLYDLINKLNFKKIDKNFLYNSAGKIREQNLHNAMSIYKYLIKNAEKNLKALSYFHIGNILLNCCKIKQAKQSLKKCLDLMPSHKMARMLLAAKNAKIHKVMTNE